MSAQDIAVSFQLSYLSPLTSYPKTGVCIECICGDIVVVSKGTWIPPHPELSAPVLVSLPLTTSQAATLVYYRVVSESLLPFSVLGGGCISLQHLLGWLGTQVDLQPGNWGYELVDPESPPRGIEVSLLATVVLPQQLSTSNKWRFPRDSTFDMRWDSDQREVARHVAAGQRIQADFTHRYMGCKFMDPHSPLAGPVYHGLAVAGECHFTYRQISRVRGHYSPATLSKVLGIASHVQKCWGEHQQEFRPPMDIERALLALCILGGTSRFQMPKTVDKTGVTAGDHEQTPLSLNVPFACAGRADLAVQIYESLHRHQSKWTQDEHFLADALCGDGRELKACFLHVVLYPTGEYHDLLLWVDANCWNCMWRLPPNHRHTEACRGAMYLSDTSFVRVSKVTRWMDPGDPSRSPSYDRFAKVVDGMVDSLDAHARSTGISMEGRTGIVPFALPEAWTHQYRDILFACFDPHATRDGGNGSGSGGGGALSGGGYFRYRDGEEGPIQSGGVHLWNMVDDQGFPTVYLDPVAPLPRTEMAASFDLLERLEPPPIALSVESGGVETSSGAIVRALARGRGPGVGQAPLLVQTRVLEKHPEIYGEFREDHSLWAPGDYSLILLQVQEGEEEAVLD